MGASFRNTDEIEELAGCDFLTISYKKFKKKLSPDTVYHHLKSKVTHDKNSFKWDLNENPMATEKLAEGIRLFAKDSRTLHFDFKATLD